MKGEKTGGRKKGSRNKLTRDVQEFVDRIFKEVDPKKAALIFLSAKTYVSQGKDQPPAEVPDLKLQWEAFKRLLEYRYGKPKEHMEVTGQVDFRDIVARMRMRAGDE